MFDTFERTVMAEQLRQWPLYVFCLLFTVWGWWALPVWPVLLLVPLLVWMTLIDMKHMVLPDGLVLPGIVLGVLCAPLLPGHGWMLGLLGAAVGFGVFATVYWGFYYVRGYYGMGFGDVKLLAMLGAWVGAQHVLLIILLSSLSALCFFALRRVVAGTATSQPMPYGPFLAFGGWLALLYGAHLWQGIFAAREHLIQFLLGGMA